MSVADDPLRRSTSRADSVYLEADAAPQTTEYAADGTANWRNANSRKRDIRDRCVHARNGNDLIANSHMADTRRRGEVGTDANRGATRSPRNPTTRDQPIQGGS